MAAIFAVAAPPAEAQVTFSAATDIDRDGTTDGVQINEGDTVVITFTASGLTGEVISRVGVSGGATGTAVDAADLTSFHLGTNQPLPIGSLPANSGGSAWTVSPSFGSSFTVTVVTTQDEDPEPDETFTVVTERHSAPGVTVTPGSITITILQNDGYTPTPMPAFSIAVDESTRAEGETAVFTVTLAGGAPDGGVTVDWAVSGAGITAGDYTLTGTDTDGTLSFTANGDQMLNVAITDDTAGEGDETLTVTLSNPSAGSITTAAAATAITDDDTVLTVSGPMRIAEGAAATYTITLTGVAFASATTVTWAVMHGTTSHADFVDADGNPFATTPTGTVGFTTSDMSGATRTFTLTAFEDDVNDAETFTLNITTAGLPAGTHVGPVLAVTIAEPDGGDTTHELLLPEVTRAVVGDMFGAVAERAGGVGGQIDGGGGFSLNGQSNWSDIVANQVNLLAAGDGVDGGIDIRDIDAKELLRGLRFASPVSAGASHDGHSHGANLAFWGGGDYRDFGGEDGDDDWDGTVFSMRFGVDGQVRDNLRAGLMLSYNDAETEYTRVESGATTKGDYESNLTSVAPYLRWQLGDGHAWASVSYGSGEVEVKPAGSDAATNDIALTGAAFGGGRKLLEQNGRELSLRADAFVAESEVDGDGDSNAAGIDDDIDVDANRIRVALAWSYPGRFAAGLLSPAFDLGLRHDGGDGRTGTGLELGGALRYRSADAGLTAEANARALIGHSGAHRGWGIGGLLRVQNGADGQGLAMSIAPGYGDFGGNGSAGSGHAGDSRLWRGGMATAGKTIAKPVARLDAEVGYGMPMSLAGGFRIGRMFGFDAGGFGDGMLTPYSALRFGDANRDYRLGLRWHANRLALDVFARHTDGATDDNAITIEGRLRF